MRYRITQNDIDKNSLTICDVLECDERLYEVDDIMVGNKFKKTIDINDFVHRSLEALKNRETILDFKIEGNTYTFKWLEVVDGKSIMHEDTLEYVGKNDVFSSWMTLLKSIFDVIKIPSQRKVTLKRFKNSDPDDEFFKYACIFYNFGENRDLGKIDAKTATKMYRYFRDHQLETSFLPVKQSKEVDKRQKGLRFAMFCFLIAAVAFIPIIIQGSIFGALFSLNALSLCLMDLLLMFSLKIDHQEKSYRALKTELEKIMDRDYLRKLDMEFEKSKSIGLVDIIEKEIESLQGKLDREDVYRLRNFEIDYTNRKIDELLGYRGSIDKYMEARILIEIRSKTYAQESANPRFLKKSSDISLSFFYDILEYLGFKKDDALKNPFLREVVSSFKGLSESPYEGVEGEQLEMIDLAVLFVRQFGLEEPQNSLDENLKDQFFKSLDTTFEKACKNYTRAVKATTIAESTQMSIEMNTGGIDERHIISMKPLK